MKTGYLFGLAVIPFVLMGTPTFDQKEKGNGNGNGNGKGKSEQRDNDNRGGDMDRGGMGRGKMNDGNNWQDKGNKGGGSDSRNDKWEDKGYKNNGNADKKDWDRNDRNDRNDDNWEKGKGKQDKWDDDDRWEDGKWDDARFDKRMSKLKNAKRNNWVNERMYNDVRWWDGQNYYDSKGPKGYKKVTICHKPDGSEYPATISVSVNALKAHMNHGDYEGECRDFDRNVYTDRFWTDRNNYYEQYYQTTETLSFGEQLLVTAIDLLTNRRSQLVTLRPTLTAQQISEREAAIIRLQNNVYDLQTSLDNGNRRVATINISF